MRHPFVLALVGLLLALACMRAASAGDLLLTGAKPDRLFVIDAETRTVRAEHRIPGANGLVATIVPSPDGRIAYALVNRMETIVGIDLDSGRTVFRAELSSPGERVKDFFAFTVTPDGRELIAYELPTRLKPAEYEVQEPRFAVFRTDAGLHARAVRRYAAPRRVHMLLMRPDGRSFYALGVDLDEYDVRTGRRLATRGIRQWQRPAYSPPDLLAFWPVAEPSGVFTSPVYAETTSGPSPVAKTALMSLDLAQGTLDYRDFESTAALIFSTVLAPDRRHAFGVYSTLTRIDAVQGAVAKRVNLDHTYYSVNIASDGRELYLGGAMCDVAFYDPESLEKRAVLKLPGCGDQSLASLRVIRRR
jgi:quinohemoprotein amine dehydrogenase beta subunit